jgi:hypothetical protein
VSKLRFPQPDAKFLVILGEDSWENLHLPSAFADSISGNTVVRLREANSSRRIDGELWFDTRGDLYIGDGWRRFVNRYGLAIGHIMVCCYYAGNKEMVFKIFNGKLTRRRYRSLSPYSSDDSGDSSSSGSDSDDLEMLSEAKAEG